jgi:hypothetical protein
MPKKSGKSASQPAPKRRRTRTADRPVKPRRLKLGKYESFRLQKRIKHPVKLPNVWRITRSAALTLWRHRRPFIIITLIYGLLNLLLAQGLAGGTDISSLKHSLDQVFTGNLGFLSSSLSIFALMVGSAGNTTDQTAGTYQMLLAVIASLAIIWALRQSFTDKPPRARDAYYRGMYPLIPFILVLAVIGIQLIPFAIGSTLYSAVINNGIAVYAAEKALWALIFITLTLLSLYMLTSSVFALYIVTLPDMTPMKALRSARELVRYRRWTVLRKILALPVILMVVALVIMLPVIILLTPLARWIFFLLTMSALTATHTYMYTLYRELLRE